MKNVILLRGIPGSGKSTTVRGLINKLGPGGSFTICSADDFFTNLDGLYVFDPTKLAQAHAACFKRFVEALTDKCDTVVVDNTFIHLWEMENYIAMAKLSGYNVEVMEIVAKTVDQVKTCIRRNTHGVPADVVCRMAIEFEPYVGATIFDVAGQ